MRDSLQPHPSAGHTTITVTPPDAVLRSPHPVYAGSRTPEEHDALRQLLLAAKDAETRAMGPDKREAFRTSRSLIAAAVVLGFSLPELADMLGVTVGSVRVRSSVLAPIPCGSFTTLLPDQLASTPLVNEARGRQDPVVLLTRYLSAVFVGAAPRGDRQASRGDQE